VLKAVLRDSVVYAVPTIVSRGMAFVLLPLYTRVLSPADYGSLDLLLVFASLVNLTVALEVSQAVARFYGTEPDEAKRIAYASTAWWFTLGCYTAFLVAAFLGAEQLSALLLRRDGLQLPFQIGIAYIWANGLLYLAQNQFRWELRSRSYAITSLLATTVTAAVGVALAYRLEWGLSGLLVGMLAGSLVGTVFAVSRLRRSFTLRFDARALREMLAFSTPLVPASIAVFVSSYVDRIMIGYLIDVEAVGLYGIGFRFASVMGLVVVGFQAALTPLVYRLHDQPDTPGDLARIFRLFVALALLLSLTLTLFAETIVTAWTTPEFSAGAMVVGPLTVAILLAQMYVFAPGIALAKKTGYIAIITVAAAAINVVLNWLLIPRLGITGAAVASVLSNGAAFGAYMVLSQRFYFVPHRWTPLLAASALALGLGFTVKALPLDPVPRAIASVVAIAVCGALLLAVRLVHASEVTGALGALRSALKPGRPAS
jgi:O-antigen/teichoic acid export membrane protein